MRFGIAYKILLLNMFVILLISGTLIGFAYQMEQNDVSEQIGRRLEAIASTGALMIDGDLHDTIKGPEDEKSDAFLKIRRVLREIKKANNLDTEVYTFRREGETLKFIAMTNAKPYIGHTYSIKEAMWPALNEGRPAHTDIYMDSHGYWLSAYAPIFDKKGNISGILDVDVKLDTFKAELKKKMFRLIVIAVVIILFSMLLSFILSHRLVGQLRYLREVTEKISLGQMDRLIKIKAKDEVGELAQSLERMRQSLKVAMSMIEEDDEEDE